MARQAYVLPLTLLPMAVTDAVKGAATAISTAPDYATATGAAIDK